MENNPKAEHCEYMGLAETVYLTYVAVYYNHFTKKYFHVLIPWLCLILLFP